MGIEIQRRVRMQWWSVFGHDVSFADNADGLLIDSFIAAQRRRLCLWFITTTGLCSSGLLQQHYRAAKSGGAGRHSDIDGVLVSASAARTHVTNQLVEF